MTEKSRCVYGACDGSGAISAVAAYPIPGVVFGGSIECLCCFEHASLVEQAERELKEAVIVVRNLRPELRAAKSRLRLADQNAKHWRAMPCPGAT